MHWWFMEKEDYYILTDNEHELLGYGYFNFVLNSEIITAGINDLI